MTESFDIAFVAPRAVVGGGETACVVGVRDGRIVAIAPFDAEFEARSIVRLAESEVLLPGLVDTHVHINEPGRTEWEGFETATLAAAAGGVTTLVDMPLNSIPATTSFEALELKRAAAAEKLHVDVGFWGGAVPGNVEQLAALYEAGVLGFKAFLIDSGVPEFAAVDEDGLLAAMTETSRLGALLIVHCEDPGVIAAAPPPRGRSYEAFLQSRPAAAEDVSIGHVLAAARATGGRAHVVHLSSSGALASLRDARAEGLRVTVETCPHYLAIDAEAIPDGGTQFKCCPPIRARENQDRLWEALFAGDIEMIVSDHSPSPASLKRLDSGDFGEAWGGIASLQLGLPIIWTAASARGRSLADVVRWMSRAPAELVGLASKGRIEVGADADLVAFDPEASFTVDPERLLHRHPVSAYAGRQLQGVVRRTWLRGAPVGEGASRHGRLISRGEQR